MHRTHSILAKGPSGTPGGGEVTLWDSGAYVFDGSGNIIRIGAQRYAYDSAQRLIAAEVLPQASDASETDPYVLHYTFDLYGNMLSRQETAGHHDVPTGL